MTLLVVRLLKLSAMLVGICVGHPYSRGFYPMPQKSIMIRSYLDPAGGSGASGAAAPKTGMSAFATGDTFVTQSFLRNREESKSHHRNTADHQYQQYDWDETPNLIRNVHGHQPAVLQQSAAKKPDAVFHPTDTTDGGSDSARGKPPLSTDGISSPQNGDRDADGDDDDDDLPFWRFMKQTRGQAPPFNSFFPIVIGGGARDPVRRRTKSQRTTKYDVAAEDDVDDAAVLPAIGSATAIANSFSTGKGGVASSHATSFGDPYMSALFRKRHFLNANNA